MHRKALLLASIAVLPLSGRAQSYLGLGATLLTNAPFATYSSPNLYDVSLSGGVQLTSRTALQLEVGYGGRTTSSTYLNYGSGITSSEARIRNLLIPLQLRYTFTNPEKPLRLDGLAGFTVLRSTRHFTSTYTNSSQTYENESSFTQYCASLGPSIRYVLTPQVELFTAAVVNMTLNDSYNSFRDRLFLSAELGAHYTFARR